MYRVLVIIIALVLLAGVVSAQQADAAAVKESVAASQSGLGVRPSQTPFSLLNSSRITWSHSYSVSFFSGGGTSSSIGLLNTTMHYELSSSLSLAVNLGVVHNTSALWGNGNYDATLLPGFRLDYHPSENFFMSISYQQGAGYYAPRDWYGRHLLQPYF